MDTLEEKQLDTKIIIEVMVMTNVMQTEIEYLALLLQMTVIGNTFLTEESPYHLSIW